MHRPAILTLSLVLVVLLVAPAAFAQTPTPAGSRGACTASTPCVDTAASASLRLGGLAVQAAAPTAEAAAATSIPGFGLAWAITVLLLLALLYAIVAAVFATLGRVLPGLPAGTRVLIPILSLLGIGVAFYLTYVETQNVAAVCGPVGDCNAVQSSPFAKLFGVLPVGLLGLLGYLAIVVAWFVARTRGGLSRVAALLMFGMALFGVLFTLYLTYLELFIIHAVCIWCLSSAVIMALVLILTVGPALEALQIDETDETE